MNALATEGVLLGAIAAVSFAIGLFFLKYWRSGRDRFYLFLSASFFIESVNRAALGLLGRAEFEPWHYWVRLLAYALIVVAIWDKNRQR
jgi:hypothetical protein